MRAFVYVKTKLKLARIFLFVLVEMPMTRELAEVLSGRLSWEKFTVMIYVRKEIGIFSLPYVSSLCSLNCLVVVVCCSVDGIPPRFFLDEFISSAGIKCLIFKQLNKLGSSAPLANPLVTVVVSCRKPPHPSDRPNGFNIGCLRLFPTSRPNCMLNSLISVLLWEDRILVLCDRLKVKNLSFRVLPFGADIQIWCKASHYSMSGGEPSRFSVDFKRRVFGQTFFYLRAYGRCIV